MPWLCLQEDLRQAGIDPARLDRIIDRSMAENLNALTEGRIEAAQFFEPVVEEALASGKGHLWYVARARLHQLHSFCHDPRAARSGCRTLIVHGQSNPADPAMALCPVCAGDAAAISSFFPALDIGVLAAALAHYQTQSVWGRDPVLPENGFDCLRRSLVSGGFIRRPMPYTACVDNRSALRVLPE
jgi:NitT/TauT family transport system substrate-binding protein